MNKNVDQTLKKIDKQYFENANKFLKRQKKRKENTNETLNWLNYHFMPIKLTTIVTL